MTARLHTPVVVFEDQEIRSEALRRGWRVVTRHPANPQVLMLSGCGTPCGIPQPTMSIFHGSLDPESLPVWRYVLNWLTRFVHNPLLVVQADDYLTDLALWASATRNWPIGAIVRRRMPCTVRPSVSCLWLGPVLSRNWRTSRWYSCSQLRT